MKKLTIVFVILILAMSLFAKGQEEKDKPDAVVVMTWDNNNATYSLLGEQPVIEYVEEKLNIDIEWQLFPHADRGTAIALMIAGGGDMPDLFPAFLGSGVSVRSLAEKGVIIPWSDMMDAGKMPFTKAKLNDPKFLVAKNQFTDDDTGKIYALPELWVNPLMIWTDYIRGDWLEKVGIKKDPETIWEYKDMLRAFKNEDPNGNGKADEIPWQNFYEGVTWVKMWSRMFDLPTPDYSLSTVDTLYWAVINGDEVVFAPTDKRFKAMLEYLCGLWQEGLINQEQFNMTSPKFTATVSNNTLGTQNMWPSAISGMTEQLRKIDPDAIWHAIPYVIDPRFMTPDKRKYAKIGPCHHPFLLARKGKNTEAAVRLIEYLFGDEEFVFTGEFGIEGVHHKINSDGNPSYIGKWADMDESTRRDAMGCIFGHLPHEHRNISVLNELDTSPKYADYREYMELVQAWEKPAFLWKLGAERNKIVRSALKDIKTYVDEGIMKFIIGTKSFDEWDDYVATINKEAGDKIDAARKIYQDYFDKSVKAYW